MSTVLERFCEVVAAAEVQGTASARIVKTSVNEGAQSITYEIETSAICYRQRWRFTEPDSGGGSSFDALPTAAGFVADDVLTGPPLDSVSGDALITLLDQALINKYPDDISSRSAARRKIYLVVGELMGAVKRNADNTFTILDPPI